MAIDLLLISMVTLLTTLLGWVIVVIPVSHGLCLVVTQSVLYCHTKEILADCGYQVRSVCYSFYCMNRLI